MFFSVPSVEDESVLVPLDQGLPGLVAASELVVLLLRGPSGGRRGWQG